MALGMFTHTHLGMLTHTHLWSAAMALGMLRAWECIRPRQLSPRASCRLSPRLRSCSTTCIPRASCMVTCLTHGHASRRHCSPPPTRQPSVLVPHACVRVPPCMSHVLVHACMCTQWLRCVPLLRVASPGKVRGKAIPLILNSTTDASRAKPPRPATEYYRLFESLRETDSAVILDRQPRRRRKQRTLITGCVLFCNKHQRGGGFAT
jgi:hypothetical protein